MLVRRVNRYQESFNPDVDRHAPLSSFSKAMRQKVLIATALLHDPEVVVLDEPRSGSTSRRRSSCDGWSARSPRAAKS